MTPTMPEHHDRMLFFQKLQTRAQFVRYLRQLQQDVVEQKVQNHLLHAYVSAISGALVDADPDPDKGSKGYQDPTQDAYGVFDELDWRHLGRIFRAATARD
jgi:hypothetical protein